MLLIFYTKRNIGIIFQLSFSQPHFSPIFAQRKIKESTLDEEKIMSAEECAGHILKAIEKRKRTLVLTSTGKQAIFMNKFFPGVADKMIRKLYFKKGGLIK